MRGYIKHSKLGEGTYASIFLGQILEGAETKLVEASKENEKGGEFVAIKHIKKTAYSTGQEISAIREIRALKCIDSPYVVKMIDVFIVNDNINLILEYMICDLESIIKCNSIIILPGDIKAWMYMLLMGLNKVHSNLMIHRDIKPNNLLISGKGILKLGDFGLTRKINNGMTPQAITRWYRAPEVLMGASSYGYSTDMWAVGAVFAEMFLRVPFFAGETDIQQLDLIFKALGTPNEEDWPMMNMLPGYCAPKRVIPPQLDQLFSAAGPEALDLLKGLLRFNPERRLTCEDALLHPYFSKKPHASKIEALPRVERNISEYFKS